VTNRRYVESPRSKRVSDDDELDDDEEELEDGFDAGFKQSN
jgi:hypothetical protein